MWHGGREMRALSGTAGYAIQALAYLGSAPHGENQVHQVREIAARTGIPEAYLTKIFQKLGVAGIVRSRRGHNGGIELVRKPASLTLLEISSAFDGSRELDQCVLGLSRCGEDEACPAHALWKTTRTRVKKILAKTTLADVLRSKTVSGAAWYRHLERESARASCASKKNRAVAKAKVD